MWPPPITTPQLPGIHLLARHAPHVQNTPPLPDPFHPLLRFQSSDPAQIFNCFLAAAKLLYMTFGDKKSHLKTQEEEEDQSKIFIRSVKQYSVETMLSIGDGTMRL